MKITEDPIRKAAARVERMEECFERLRQAAESGEIPEDCLLILTRYCESGQWLRDYELDEKGCFPPDLKRGVLSQDALYDLLETLKNDCL